LSSYLQPYVDRKFRELEVKGIIFTMPSTDGGDEWPKLAVYLDPDGVPFSIGKRKR